MTEDSENLVFTYAAIFYGRGQQYKVGKRNMGSVKEDDRVLHEMLQSLEARLISINLWP